MCRPCRPSPPGRSRTNDPYREGVERRSETAEHLLTEPLAVGRSGISARSLDTALVWR